MARHLYVHVPFCARKCAYCAFYSEAGHGERVKRYLDALIREMELVVEEAQEGGTPAWIARPGASTGQGGGSAVAASQRRGPGLRTVFFGGGTPSILTLKQWEKLLRAMERLGLLGAEEWTIECNPATVSLDKARLWRAYGVNRVSLGVQSLNDELLDRLGRVHTRATVFKSYDTFRAAGFDNLNLDLMFAIPGQTLKHWRETLREALALQCEHLACYEVIYEEDTPLFEQLKAGRFEVDEDLAAAMYDALIDLAAAHGFRQYEIANFARHRGAAPVEIPDLACQHNINYWRGGSYQGLGPSAAGYIRGVRTKNWSDIDLYCDLLARRQRPVESRDQLPPLARAGETAAFGLRMNVGWRFEEFERVTGFDLREHWAGAMEELTRLGWGCFTQDGFRLTPPGLRFADAAAERFVWLPAESSPGHSE